jgi:hypothetical protein
MNSTSNQETQRIFNILIYGRSIDRYTALENLVKPNSGIERGLLRTQIAYAVSHEYASKPNQTTDKDPKAMVRRFLLNALARICDEDKTSSELVRKHLDFHDEPNRWVRCDVIAGLVAVNAPDLKVLAREIKRNDPHPWLIMLATAVLAGAGDPDAVKEIKTNLCNGDKNSTLRALRIVPLEDVLDEMIVLANPDQEDSNSAYNAIVALGCIPNTWPHAQKAADALQRYLEFYHENWWLDGPWAKTLEALGNLRIARTASSIMEEFTSDNPKIIFEAARALEKILGVPIAVARVVEAASHTDRMFLEGYASALRWMNRDLVVEKLEEMMASGPVEQQETARILLIELGGLSAFQKVQARKMAIAHYTEQLEKAEDQVRDMFKNSIAEAQNGYKLASYMDFSVFILGSILIVVSAILALINQGNLDSWAGSGLVSGGAGVLGVLYALIKDPRRRIPEEVDHLMYLKVIFLGYLRQLHQVDQAFTRSLLEDQQLSPTELEKYSRLVERTMQSAVVRIRQDVSSMPEDQTKNDDKPAETTKDKKASVSESVTRES